MLTFDLSIRDWNLVHSRVLEGTQDDVPWVYFQRIELYEYYPTRNFEDLLNVLLALKLDHCWADRRNRFHDRPKQDPVSCVHSFGILHAMFSDSGLTLVRPILD